MLNREQLPGMWRRVAKPEATLEPDEAQAVYAEGHRPPRYPVRFAKGPVRCRGR
jgi:hypothetical protein